MKNKGFYERYKNEQKAKEKEQKVRKKYNISDDKTVIIKEKNKIDKILFSLASSSVLKLPSFNIWTIRLPSAVPSTGPA